jgi:hypothetical protein
MRKLLERPRAVAGLSLNQIDADSRLFQASNGNYSLHMLEQQNQGREQAERFIHNAYRRVFNANLKNFYPGIVSLNTRRGGLNGAVGVRYAQGQALFLEQYLDDSAESRLSAVAGQPAGRDSIVELGNLSVSRPAMTYPFINLMGNWLSSYRVEWMIFALTRTLRGLFERSGVEMLELGTAYQSSLSPDDTDWGNYYLHDPRIMAINLPTALVQFQQQHPLTSRPRRDLLLAPHRVCA